MARKGCTHYAIFHYNYRTKKWEFWTTVSPSTKAKVWPYGSDICKIRKIVH